MASINVNRGDIIVFSGLDCAGKSTQIQLLTATLTRKGTQPVYLWVRGGYTPLFRVAKTLLRKLSRGSILPPCGRTARRQERLLEPRTRRLWLLISIVDLILVYGVYLRILKALRKTVICDRYLWDTAVDFRLNFPQEKVEDWLSWRLLAWLTPQPNAAFLLLIPVEESLRRSKLKSEPFPDSAETLAQRLAAYKGFAAEERWRVICATPSVDAVAAEIHNAMGYASSAIEHPHT